MDKAIAIINVREVAAEWGEPEALGWAYQFFNTKTERKRDPNEQAPRNSRELAIRNQFFTPRYVVDWLVQNTLGRRLREAGYELDLPLLVGELGDRALLALEQVRVLDPAVGSGHFLLGCYDLLEQAWQTQGVPPSEAAPHILCCLHGIDIDPRASQVAQAVLVLRARRSAPRADLQPPAIVTARALPAAPDVRREIFERLSPNARGLAKELNEALELAPKLGSLLKVEQRVEAAFQQALQTPMLDEEEVTVERLEGELTAAIGEITRQADATPAARLFAADASDAMRFMRLCKHRYDVVLMNPPFGDPIPDTKKYVQVVYGRSGADMDAAFVHRGIKLLNEHGYLGAITPRNGFFVTTYEDWRANLVLPRTLGLIDLGKGVMRDAMVEAAAYFLSARPHHGQASIRRLLDESDKASAVYEGTDKPFLRSPGDFIHLPGAPAAYWLSGALLRRLRLSRPLEDPGNVEVRQGSPTSDDFRYLRCWWEVPVSGALGDSPRWVSFAKGGEYSPYYSHVHLVVDRDYSRGTFTGFYGRKSRPSPRPQNRSYFGRPGLTWSVRSQKGFCVRPVPAGAIFGHKGSMIFVSSDASGDLDRLMAYLNSGMAAALLEAMVAFGSYEVGAVQRLPHIDPGVDAGALARELTRIRMAEAERLQTDHLFVSPWVSNSDTGSALKVSRQVDEAVSRAIDDDTIAHPLSATYPTHWFEEEYDPPNSPMPHQELSYLLGASFGRWDVRMALGMVEPPPLPGPYDPLPPVSRGMLVGEDGLPARQLPDGYPLNLPAERLLHDEPGHSRDVVAGIEAVIELLEGSPQSLCLALPQGVSDLRSWLRGRFFADHVKDYSASRRYAPIYWYLTVPSRDWGLWVYAPALSREVLFAIAAAAHDKLRRLREQVAQLRGSTDRDAIERLERAEGIAMEVEQFADHADRVAQSGWQPDLNDGLVLCAAPMEPLFADDTWRRRVAQYRKDLEESKYPWATVQREFFGGPS